MNKATAPRAELVRWIVDTMAEGPGCRVQDGEAQEVFGYLQGLIPACFTQ